MGAVTALLYSQTDPSIAGVVCHSPILLTFCLRMSISQHLNSESIVHMTDLGQWRANWKM